MALTNLKLVISSLTLSALLLSRASVKSRNKWPLENRSWASLLLFLMFASLLSTAIVMESSIVMLVPSGLLHSQDRRALATSGQKQTKHVSRSLA